MRSAARPAAPDITGNVALRPLFQPTSLPFESAQGVTVPVFNGVLLSGTASGTVPLARC